LASLSEDENTRLKLASIISEQKRSLQNEACVTINVYESIRTAIDDMANGIADLGDRGHFMGGIVRLAAHDFMDFNFNAEDKLGSDGCLDFTNGANAGLPDLWCDDAASCPFKALYDESYSSIMSRADFWIAAANAVIWNSSAGNNPLDIPFRWGRIDSNDCPNSSSRLPEPGGCNDVEDAFITRMGLTWTDAVALMGAHTLGRGDADFSGHQGTWVQDDTRSTVFDNGFYREMLRRGWSTRDTDETVPDNDWTWGREDRNVMMLNTDICLRYDIDDGSPCCTNTDQNCRREPDNQCPDSSQVRPEAFEAVNNFGGDTNTAFFEAFTSAWVRATENGHDSLKELANTCVETQAPTQSPIGSCSDLATFKDRKGKDRDCSWVLSRDKCNKFLDECPVSCNACS